MVALVKEMPLQAPRNFLRHPVVDDFLDLCPPLETVLSDPQERLEGEAAAKEIARIRELAFFGSGESSRA
jgi:hypothetical protein